MKLIVRPQSNLLGGSATVPGDKSIGHRALLFGGLCSGVVEVTGVGGGEDNLRTRRAMEAFGVGMKELGPGRVEVHGVGLDGLHAASGTVDCGNSGTSIRLLTGLLSGQSFETTLAGDESLSVRPMRRVIDPLTEMGASISGQAGAKPGEVYPPLTVSGSRLRGIRYDSPIASAQVKSAILLAGLYAEGETEVVEPGPSRDHTERMLRYLGAPLEVRPKGALLKPDGWSRRLEPRPLAVPGDPSSAAFLVAAALLAGGDRVAVTGICTNRTRTGFLDALASMGAVVEAAAAAAGAEREPVADLVVEGGAGQELVAAELRGELIVRAIDELPVLAVVATRAAGTTHIREAAELRVKESDRIATTAAMLRAFGVEVEERPDGMSIIGVGRDRKLAAATIDASGDHRIAMSAAVAALCADGEVVIENAANVRTSFPTFAAVMSELGADVRFE